MPTQTNPQIVDAVSGTNLEVLGDSPAQAQGMTFQALAHAVGLAMQNATQSQGSMQQIALSSVTVLCKAMLEVTPSGGGS